jgi:hypothetical protein
MNLSRFSFAMRKLLNYKKKCLFKTHNCIKILIKIRKEYQQIRMTKLKIKIMKTLLVDVQLTMLYRTQIIVVMYMLMMRI